MSLWSIFISMVGAGLSAVGGAWGTLAAAQTAWVRPGGLTPEQFAWAASLGQITPGPITVLVVALGWQLRQAAGAAAALAGLLLPTWIVASVAGHAVDRYRQVVLPFTPGMPWIMAAMAGTAGLRLALPLHLSPWEAAVGAVAAVAVAWKQVEPVWVLALAAAAGGALALVQALP